MHEGGQQTRRSSVAVVIRVDGGVLVVCNPSPDGHRQLIHVNPTDEPLHQPRNVLRLRWPINDASGMHFADNVLPVARPRPDLVPGTPRAFISSEFHPASNGTGGCFPAA